MEHREGKLSLMGPTGVGNIRVELRSSKLDMQN